MKKFVFNLFAVAAFIVCSLNLNALEVGDKAPSFELLDDQGNTWKSESFRGKKLLLVYFYPAAMTGGCTKQACAFRDDREKWRERNVEVVGISGDQPKDSPCSSGPRGLISPFGRPGRQGGQSLWCSCRQGRKHRALRKGREVHPDSRSHFQALDLPFVQRRPCSLQKRQGPSPNGQFDCS